MLLCYFVLFSLPCLNFVSCECIFHATECLQFDIFLSFTSINQSHKSHFGTLSTHSLLFLLDTQALTLDKTPSSGEEESVSGETGNEDVESDEDKGFENSFLPQEATDQPPKKQSKTHSHSQQEKARAKASRVRHHSTVSSLLCLVTIDSGLVTIDS